MYTQSRKYKRDGVNSVKKQVEMAALTIPWDLRPVSQPNMGSMRRVLSSRYFWFKIVYALRSTLIAYVPALLFSISKSTSYLLVSHVFVIVGAIVCSKETFGFAMSAFVGWLKAIPMTLPICTLLVYLELEENIYAWSVMYMAYIVVIGFFCEGTTMQLGILFYNVCLIAQMNRTSTVGITYPIRLCAEFTFGCLLGVLSTLLPFPKLAMHRADKKISDSCQNISLCCSGLCSTFWTTNNLQRRVNMVRIAFAKKSTLANLAEAEASLAMSQYEIFQSVEAYRLRKSKVYLLKRLLALVDPCLRVVEAVTDNPQIMEESNYAINFGSRLSPCLKEIAHGVDASLLLIAEGRTVKDLQLDNNECENKPQTKFKEVNTQSRRRSSVFGENTFTNLQNQHLRHEQEMITYEHHHHNSYHNQITQHPFLVLRKAVRKFEKAFVDARREFFWSHRFSRNVHQSDQTNGFKTTPRKSPTKNTVSSFPSYNGGANNLSNKFITSIHMPHLTSTPLNTGIPTTSSTALPFHATTSNQSGRRVQQASKGGIGAPSSYLHGSDQGIGSSQQKYSTAAHGPVGLIELTEMEQEFEGIMAFYLFTLTQFAKKTLIFGEVEVMQLKIESNKELFWIITESLMDPLVQSWNSLLALMPCLVNWFGNFFSFCSSGCYSCCSCIYRKMKRRDSTSDTREGSVTSEIPNNEYPSYSYVDEEERLSRAAAWEAHERTKTARSDLIEAIKTSASMGLALGFFYITDPPTAFIGGGPTIIAFVCAHTAAEALQASLQRLFGTLLGVVVAYFANTHANSFNELVVAATILLFISGFFRSGRQYGVSAMYVSFVTSEILVPNLTSQQAVAKGHRAVFALLIYMFICAAFFPTKPADELLKKRILSLKALSAAMSWSLSSLSAPFLDKGGQQAPILKSSSTFGSPLSAALSPPSSPLFVSDEAQKSQQDLKVKGSKVDPPSIFEDMDKKSERPLSLDLDSKLKPYFADTTITKPTSVSPDNDPFAESVVVDESVPEYAPFRNLLGESYEEPRPAILDFTPPPDVNKFFNMGTSDDNDPGNDKLKNTISPIAIKSEETQQDLKVKSSKVAPPSIFEGINKNSDSVRPAILDFTPPPDVNKFLNIGPSDDNDLGDDKSKPHKIDEDSSNSVLLESNEEKDGEFDDDSSYDEELFLGDTTVLSKVEKNRLMGLSSKKHSPGKSRSPSPRKKISPTSIKSCPHLQFPVVASHGNAPFGATGLNMNNNTQKDTRAVNGKSLSFKAFPSQGDTTTATHVKCPTQQETQTVKIIDENEDEDIEASLFESDAAIRSLKSFQEEAAVWVPLAENEPTLSRALYPSTAHKTFHLITCRMTSLLELMLDALKTLRIRHEPPSSAFGEFLCSLDHVSRCAAGILTKGVDMIIMCLTRCHTSLTTEIVALSLEFEEKCIEFHQKKSEGMRALFNSSEHTKKSSPKNMYQGKDFSSLHEPYSCPRRVKDSVLTETALLSLSPSPKSCTYNPNHKGNVSLSSTGNYRPGGDPYYSIHPTNKHGKSRHSASVDDLSKLSTKRENGVGTSFSNGINPQTHAGYISPIEMPMSPVSNFSLGVDEWVNLNSMYLGFGPSSDQGGTSASGDFVRGSKKRKIPITSHDAEGVHTFSFCLVMFANELKELVSVVETLQQHELAAS